MGFSPGGTVTPASVLALQRRGGDPAGKAWDAPRDGRYAIAVSI
jgi:hypothetical protein